MRGSGWSRRSISPTRSRGLADRIGHRPVLLPAMALLSVAVASIAAVHSVPALVGVGLLFGLAQGFIYPTMNAYAVGLVDPSQIGQAQASYNGAFNLGTTFGSFMFGHVAHTYGHRVMFVECGAVVLIALAVFAVGDVGGRRPAGSTPIVEH
jgi:predicted MFS family arabinose efflux permease